MKNKITSLLVAMLILAVMSSCKDDSENEIDDNTAPQIAFTSHEADADVWNTITIKTEVTEESALEKVEFYVGGTLVEEVKTAPFNMTLNTKNYDDGAVEIKAVAYDKVGNKSEKTLSLNIENTLVSFTVPENFASDLIVFLSDNEGNVLESKSIDYNAPALFLRPDGFEDEVFSLSTFVPSSFRNEIITYTDIVYGSEFGFRNVILIEIKGQATITFDDLSNNWATSVIFPSGNFRLGGVCMDCSIELDLLRSPTDLFISHEDLEGSLSYKFVPDVEVNDEIFLEVNGFLPMTNSQIGFPSGFESGYTLLSGLKSRENYHDDRYFMYSKTFDETIDVDFFYPKNVFDGFETSYHMTKGSKTYSYQAIAETVSPFAASTIDVDISFSSKYSMTATATGEYDLFEATWSFKEAGKTTWHRVYGKATDNIEALRPLIPQAILEAYPSITQEKFEAGNLLVRDYINVENYSDYINYHLNSNIPLSNKLSGQQYVTENIDPGN